MKKFQKILKIELAKFLKEFEHQLKKIKLLT